MKSKAHSSLHGHNFQTGSARVIVFLIVRSELGRPVPPLPPRLTINLFSPRNPSLGDKTLSGISGNEKLCGFAGDLLSFPGFGTFTVHKPSGKTVAVQLSCRYETTLFYAAFPNDTTEASHKNNHTHTSWFQLTHNLHQSSDGRRMRQANELWERNIGFQRITDCWLLFNEPGVCTEISVVGLFTVFKVAFLGLVVLAEEI